ncbi:hypothetical protein [Streptomyces sp. NPDC001657]|uniref:hypothetical protein n=1 Tax=Streptomyces sp. NPDC001657 TaxID=3154522 RepID=UPI0033315301
MTEHRNSATASARRPPLDVPRWARRAAHAVPLVILPSGLWRIGVMLAVPGFGGAAARAQGTGTHLYLLVLVIVSEGLGLLTLGLVRPWGEVVPRRVPLLGGRTVPPPAAVVPAALGALAATGVVCYFFASVLLTGFPPGHTPTEELVLTVCYLPLLAWGPLVGVLAYAYHRRRTGN